MGLCPTCRVVTTLFCVQHRRNVCEKCMVTDHPACVVKSYVKWLEDADFDPRCPLCSRDLMTEGGPTVRLCCHDVFHWQCLDDHCKALPSTTAPAGYGCPTCSAPIIPPAHLVSPVAVALRERLQLAPWATAGLDSTADESLSLSRNASVAQESERDRPAPQLGKTELPPAFAKLTAPSATAAAGPPSRAGAAAPLITGTGLGVVSRRPPAPNVAVAIPNDPDEDKYARRPVRQWLGTMSKRTSVRTRSGDDVAPNLKIATVVMVLAIILVITIIELLTRARPDHEWDPVKDPHMMQHGQAHE